MQLLVVFKAVQGIFACFLMAFLLGVAFAACTFITVDDNF